MYKQLVLIMFIFLKINLIYIRSIDCYLLWPSIPESIYKSIYLTVGPLKHRLHNSTFVLKDLDNDKFNYDGDRLNEDRLNNEDRSSEEKRVNDRNENKINEKRFDENQNIDELDNKLDVRLEDRSLFDLNRTFDELSRLAYNLKETFLHAFISNLTRSTDQLDDQTVSFDENVEEKRVEKTDKVRAIDAFDRIKEPGQIDNASRIDDTLVRNLNEKLKLNRFNSTDHFNESSYHLNQHQTSHTTNYTDHFKQTNLERMLNEPYRNGEQKDKSKQINRTLINENQIDKLIQTSHLISNKINGLFDSANKATHQFNQSGQFNLINQIKTNLINDLINSQKSIFMSYDALVRELNKSKIGSMIDRNVTSRKVNLSEGSSKLKRLTMIRNQNAKNKTKSNNETIRIDQEDDQNSQFDTFFEQALKSFYTSFFSKMNTSSNEFDSKVSTNKSDSSFETLFERFLSSNPTLFFLSKSFFDTPSRSTSNPPFSPSRASFKTITQKSNNSTDKFFTPTQRSPSNKSREIKFDTLSEKLKNLSFRLSSNSPSLGEIMSPFLKANSTLPLNEHLKKKLIRESLMKNRSNLFELLDHFSNKSMSKNFHSLNNLFNKVIYNNSVDNHDHSTRTQKNASPTAPQRKFDPKSKELFSPRNKSSSKDDELNEQKLSNKKRFENVQLMNFRSGQRSKVNAREDVAMKLVKNEIEDKSKINHNSRTDLASNASDVRDASKDLNDIQSDLIEINDSKTNKRKSQKTKHEHSQVNDDELRINRTYENFERPNNFNSSNGTQKFNDFKSPENVNTLINSTSFNDAFESSKNFSAAHISTIKANNHKSIDNKRIQAKSTVLIENLNETSHSSLQALNESYKANSSIFESIFKFIHSSIDLIEDHLDGYNRQWTGMINFFANFDATNASNLRSKRSLKENFEIDKTNEHHLFYRSVNSSSFNDTSLSPNDLLNNEKNSSNNLNAISSHTSNLASSSFKSNKISFQSLNQPSYQPGKSIEKQNDQYRNEKSIKHSNQKREIENNKPMIRHNQNEDSQSKGHSNSPSLNNDHEFSNIDKKSENKLIDIRSSTIALDKRVHNKIINQTSNSTSNQLNNGNQFARQLLPTQTNEDFHQKLGISGEEANENYLNSSIGDLYNGDHEVAAIPMKNPEEMLVPWSTNQYFFPIIITYIISFIIGVTGNILVIWLMLANKDNRNVTTLFLVSLSVSDLLLLIIYGPLEIINFFVLKWEKDTICHLSAFAESVSAFGSLLNLLAVTLERFVVIVFPIQSRTLCAMHNCKRVLAGVWILAFFLALPMFFIKTTTKASYTNGIITVNVYYCKDINTLFTSYVYVYRLLTMFIIPSIIMIACYTWVIKELWISTRNLNNIQTNLTKCTSPSFEMNMLPNNQNDQLKDKQSKSRKLANNLNSNVINLKNKLIKHCRLNRKTNQETSFIDCDGQADNLNENINKYRQTNNNVINNGNSIIQLTTTKHTIDEWSNFDDIKSIKNENDENGNGNALNAECTEKECIQTMNCLTIDHNFNHDKGQMLKNENNVIVDMNLNENSNELNHFERPKEVSPKEDLFIAKFEDVNFDDYTIDEDKTLTSGNFVPKIETKQIGKQTKKHTDQNDKIIDEFLLYTNKLASDSDLISTNNNASSSNTQSYPSMNTIKIDATSDPSNEGNKNYYNCSDKLLDASALASRNTSLACILEEEHHQTNRLNRNQSNANYNINIPNPVNQPKVVLRRHMRKEALDAKSARKQVIKMLILIVVLFLICWGPRLIMEMIIKCCLANFNHVTYALRIVFYLLPFIHSCLNPIVYTFMSTKFRTQLINIWHKLRIKRCGRRKHNQGFQKQCSSRQTTIQSDNCTTKIVTVDTCVN